jgi:LacI family transcriptional regulator
MSNVTIKDIANETGVSIATVSRVLNNSGYASSEIRERILAVAKELNYQPNAVARSLKMHRTNTIGVIVPDISNPYFMKISKGIEDTILQNGYHLIFASGDENPQKERDMLQVLFEKRVDAIVLATSGNNEEMINKIKDAGIPVILVDRKLKEENGLDLVVEDNEDGAYQLTNYLIKQGHSRIGVVNGHFKVSVGIERFNGYQKALKENNIEEDPDLIFNGNFHQDGGISAVDQFMNLSKPPTAILSCNNTMAFGVLLQLRRLGYDIPKDIVVVSYGDVEAARLLHSSGIVRVDQFPYEMGVRVGHILIDRLVENVKGPVQEVFQPTLNINQN